MKIEIKNNLAYVSSTWINILISIMSIVVLYYIWQAVYKNNTSINGINKQQIITYIVLVQIFYSQFVDNSINQRIGMIIHKGQIGNELLRPMDFQLYLYFISIGKFLFYQIIQGAFIFITAKILFHIMFPASLINGVFFGISLFFAVSIGYLIDFIVGLIAFYTVTHYGLHIFKRALITFFSGALIPPGFFPDWLQNIVNILPFKDIVYTPISIYLGIVTGEKMISAICYQILWIIGLIMLSRLFYLFAIKKVIVQGG